MTMVKICGITNSDDARLAEKFGADALGFNFYPKSPRYVTPDKAGSITRSIGGEVWKVGVFVNESLENILTAVETAGLNAIQLHGDETSSFVSDLKVRTTAKLMKAFRVGPDFDASAIDDYDVDAILLDAFSSGEYGGTGLCFDLGIAKKVDRRRLILAGGLTTENVNAAISSIRPYGVDVCSSIESSPGKKDEQLLRDFILRARRT
ncbi:MAG: phosphoribosylanthranilate isomerase [Pyrinomonadaceae bacterium]